MALRRFGVAARAMILAGIAPVAHSFHVPRAAVSWGLRTQAVSAPITKRFMGGGGSEIPQVTVGEAQSILEGGDDSAKTVVYLDVRTEPEFQQIRVPGSVLVTAFEAGPAGMTPVPDFMEKVAEMYPDKSAVKLLVGCKSGMRSAAATSALAGAGYDATNIAGGITEWAASELPTETGSQA
mmetsp:Transcript_2086/g.9147  ORF Transcript_2086/g.9147 Transcript_2086/m.9147 type:complete len:181 (+) Transcript_2086:81-623(+)